jgi:hypothetical protein
VKSGLCLIMVDHEGTCYETWELEDWNLHKPFARAALMDEIIRTLEVIQKQDGPSYVKSAKEDS